MYTHMRVHTVVWAVWVVRGIVVKESLLRLVGHEPALALAERVLGAKVVGHLRGGYKRFSSDPGRKVRHLRKTNAQN